MSGTFQASLQRGKIGESKIAGWLRSQGYNILPVYEKEINEGKGPQLFTASLGGLIAPDMFCFKADKFKWVEAKHKSVFSWYRIGGYWETGIDIRHYEDYQKVASISPFPVWLLFLHEKEWTKEPPHNTPAGLFGGELMKLTKCESHRSDKWGRSGMVYWAHQSLTQFATLQEVETACYQFSEPSQTKPPIFVNQVMTAKP